jgi:transcriptional regulator with XRE-family HTH domain
MKVGENIRKIREIKGIKQDDLASMLGITQAAYSKIERNETDLTLPRLSQIAEKLGVKEEDILFWDPSAIFNNSTVHSYNNFGTFYNQGLADKERDLYEKLLAAKDQESLALQKTIKLLESRISN